MKFLQISLANYTKAEGESISPSESLIDSTVLEWYSEKHRRASREEIDLINGVAVPSCPYCGSARFRKDGKRRDGIQKHLCLECHRRFNQLTGTVFDSRKIPISEWIEFLLHLFEFHSVRTSARDNRNAATTGVYWLRKVFAVLEGCQDGVVLSGRVWMDETFASVDKSERTGIGGKAKRSLSRDKIAIAVATDGKSLVISLEGIAKPSSKSTLSAFSGRIKPESVLVHDGDKSHLALISVSGLSSEVHPTSETRGLADADNPMDEINDVHSLFKAFLRGHGGFDRADIGGWCNLFWFIWSRPAHRLEKVAKFIEMAISTRKRIKYREVFSRKVR